MGRTVTKSIAIIGEGETEWFYFDSLRIACRLSFQGRSGFSAAQRHQSYFETCRVLFEQAI